MAPSVDLLLMLGSTWDVWMTQAWHVWDRLQDMVIVQWNHDVWTEKKSGFYHNNQSMFDVLCNHQSQRDAFFLRASLLLNLLHFMQLFQWNCPFCIILVWERFEMCLRACFIIWCSTSCWYITIFFCLGSVHLIERVYDLIVNFDWKVNI